MTFSWPKANRSLGFVDALGVVGLLGFGVARFVPLERLPFWSCGFRESTGWPCLGCGLTRAAQHLSKGELFEAFAANPLGATAGLLFALAGVLTVLHLSFKLPLPEVSVSAREGKWVRVGLVLLVALNWGFVAMRTRMPEWP